jgi:hypothetical protein
MSHNYDYISMADDEKSFPNTSYLDQKGMIANKEQIYEFYNEVIPEIERDEIIHMFMQSRRKYNSTIRISEHDPVLGRKMLKYNDNDLFFNKIEQLEALSKVAISHSSGDKLPIDAMVIYIDLSPKSTKKAFAMFSEFYTDVLISNEPDDIKYKHFRKIDVKLASFIHKSNARKPYYMIDVDTKDTEIFDGILDMIPNSSKNIDWITETRGGYHMIIGKDGAMKRQLGKIVHTEILPKYKEVVEVMSSKRSPATVVCGTYQGGFVTKRVEI